MESEALSTRPADGPYWVGPELSLVDLTFYPWFEQLAALQHFRDVCMPHDARRLVQWWEAVAQRGSLRAIAKPPQFYIDHYPRHDAELAAARDDRAAFAA